MSEIYYASIISFRTIYSFIRGGVFFQILRIIEKRIQKSQLFNSFRHRWRNPLDFAGMIIFKTESIYAE